MTAEDCELCKNSSQIIWRVTTVEKKVCDLEKTLSTIKTAVIANLIGILVIIAQGWL